MGGPADSLITVREDRAEPEEISPQLDIQPRLFQGLPSGGLGEPLGGRQTPEGWKGFLIATIRPSMRMKSVTS